MSDIVAWFGALALSLGGPGLFLIAFLDSSFLSLPEINDLLVVWLVIRHKERMAYYALMATLGSMTGCWLLYVIGRKGGDAVLRRRFHRERIDEALASFNRYGVLALLVPAILPPPAPFKIFVLLGGVAHVSPWRFSLAIGCGRGLRYFAEGILAVRYGDQAMEFIRLNGRVVAVLVAVAVLVLGVGYTVWHRRRLL